MPHLQFCVCTFGGALGGTAVKGFLAGWALLLLTGCQMIAPKRLALSPLPMPVRAVMLQGRVIKGEQSEPLNVVVEADQQQVQVVVLNAFGQRSRSLVSTARGWRLERVIPGGALIADDELLTSLLCVLAGPQYGQLQDGYWQGLDLIQDKGAVVHHVEHQGNPWQGASRYQKRSNGQLVFELQWLAAPY